MIDTEKQAERAILIGLVYPGQDEYQSREYLAELAFLTETAGAEPVNTFLQRLDLPDPRTFVGSGKIAEIAAFVTDNKINIAIFDDELSPSQLRNIENTLGCRVLDRTNLILDIFARRARTSHARTQVELAQYQYLLPRLTRMWTHLERQRGGIGLRGPGETEIETDRRIIRDKIALLKVQLKKIDMQMSTQRKNRGKMVRVALVGYTNVGKSTIMNLVSKSEVFAENKLFATLDTTVRKVVIANLPFLLSDTVGFIRKLPHDLVESFKSTLDEVRESDLLLHIIDISHPGFEEQIKIVEETLKELKSANKPVILVFNKIDSFAFTTRDHDDLTPAIRENYSLNDLKKSWMASDKNHTSGAGEYVPGDTYTICLDIADPQAHRWGFEITLIDASGTKAGVLSPVDAQTQVSDSLIAGDQRQYGKHTLTGTSPGTPGGKSWTMEWLAPATGTGTVTLYGMGNAANNDDRSTGDYIYSLVVPLSEAEPTAAEPAPLAAVMAPNFPNPFNPKTRLSFDLSQPASVRLSILDSAGRLVKVVHAGPIGAGAHDFAWDGRDAQGEASASGVYFARLQDAAGRDLDAPAKMTLMK